MLEPPYYEDIDRVRTFHDLLDTMQYHATEAVEELKSSIELGLDQSTLLAIKAAEFYAKKQIEIEVGAGYADGGNDDYQPFYHWTVREWNGLDPTWEITNADDTEYCITIEQAYLQALSAAIHMRKVILSREYASSHEGTPILGEDDQLICNCSDPNVGGLWPDGKYYCGRCRGQYFR